MHSSFQLPFHAFGANSNSLIALHPRENLSIVEATMATYTSEAFIMVLAAQGLHILAYDRPSALCTLGSLSLCTLRLAIETPGITVLLNMSHALLERVAAFSAEEMAIVPMCTESNSMLANDGSLAMLASRCEELVPVKMAIETEPLVAIFSHCLTFDFFELFALSTTLNARKALCTMLFGLRTDF